MERPIAVRPWRVRDVVAHMLSYDGLGPPAVIRRFAAAGFTSDPANALGVAAFADHSPDDLLAVVKDHLQPCGLTAGFGGRIALTDALIHHQDIRRRLRLPPGVPAERCAPLCVSHPLDRRSTPVAGPGRPRWPGVGPGSRTDLSGRVS
jgi:hypothetical protein